MSDTIPFKEILRKVVNGNIASARTEKRRLHFYRWFWSDIARNARAELKEFGVPPPTSEIHSEVQERIEQQQRDGVTPGRLSEIDERFKEWLPTIYKARGRKGAKKRWKNKKPLDRA